MHVREISLDQIVPSRNIRRGDLDVAELTESIREHGILQPIRVRPVGDGRFQIISGHRRVAASRGAGKRAIPAVVAEEAESRAAAQSVVENLQRENLSPVDLIRGIKELQSGYGLSEDAIARAISKSPAQVRMYLRASRLPDEILAQLESGEGRTQDVRGLTVRHVAPLMTGVSIEEAGTRIQQLFDKTVKSGIRINAHMADAIARSVGQGRMSVADAVDAVLREPDKYRYGRAPSNPAELEGDTWQVYRRLHREIQTLAAKLRPEVASAFQMAQKRDLLDRLDQLTAWLGLYRAALEFDPQSRNPAEDAVLESMDAATQRQLTTDLPRQR